MSFRKILMSDLYVLQRHEFTQPLRNRQDVQQTEHNGFQFGI